MKGRKNKIPHKYFRADGLIPYSSASSTLPLGGGLYRGLFDFGLISLGFSTLVLPPVATIEFFIPR